MNFFIFNSKSAFRHSYIIKFKKKTHFLEARWVCSRLQFSNQCCIDANCWLDVVGSEIAMTIFSKYYAKSLRLATCQDIVHPETDCCWKAALYCWTVPLPTLCKFFLPLLIVECSLAFNIIVDIYRMCYNFLYCCRAQIPLVVNRKRLDRKLIREILQDYGSALFTTFIVGTSGMNLVCVLQ